MVVRSCNLWKVFGNLVEGALSQIAGKREHVGFVHQCQVLARARGGKFECVTHTTLYTARSVHTSLRCNFVRCPLTQHAAFACIRTFCVFANHNKLVRHWCCAVGQPQPCAHRPVDVRTGARFGARHCGHWQSKPSRGNLVRRASLAVLGRRCCCCQVAKGVRNASRRLDQRNRLGNCPKSCEIEKLSSVQHFQ